MKITLQLHVGDHKTDQLQLRVDSQLPADGREAQTSYWTLGGGFHNTSTQDLERTIHIAIKSILEDARRAAVFGRAPGGWR